VSITNYYCGSSIVGLFTVLSTMSLFLQAIKKTQVPTDPFKDHAGQRSTELKLDSDQQTLSQFQKRYGISNDTTPAVHSSGPPGKDRITPVPPMMPPGSSSTFVGDQSFPESPQVADSSKRDFTHRAAKEKQKRMNVFQKAIGQKRRTNKKSVSLADLANDKKTETGRLGRELKESDKPSSILDTTLVLSNETSLSSSE